MITPIFRRAPGLFLPLLLLAAAPLPAEEAVAPPAAVVAEKPEPMPPVGREVRTVPHRRTVAKDGFSHRRARAQTSPVVLPQSRLNTSPFAYVGYVSFLEGGVAYQGSGTVVRPKSVLACAHLLWSPGTGWSTNVKFYRARYGSSYKKLARANRLYIHGNYQSSAQTYGQNSSYTFAWDIAWMTFASPIAGGGYSGYATNYGALTGTNYCVAVGYGGGSYPKYSEPSRSYLRFGGTAYFTNSSYDHQGGMSGGPIFATIGGKKYVDAVIVSSGGGVRAIDSYMFGQIGKLP